MASEKDPVDFMLAQLPRRTAEKLPPDWFLDALSDTTKFMPGRYTSTMAKDVYGATILDVPFEGPTKKDMEALRQRVDREAEPVPVWCGVMGVRPTKVDGKDVIYELSHAMSARIDKHRKVIVCQESRAMGLPLRLRQAFQEYFPECAIVAHHIPQQARTQGICAYASLRNLESLRRGEFPVLGAKGWKEWQRRFSRTLHEISGEENDEETELSPDAWKYRLSSYGAAGRAIDAQKVWKDYWGMPTLSRYQPIERIPEPYELKGPFLPTIWFPPGMERAQRERILSDYYPFCAETELDAMRMTQDYLWGGNASQLMERQLITILDADTLVRVGKFFGRAIKGAIRTKDEKDWTGIRCPLPMEIEGLPPLRGVPAHFEKKPWWRTPVYLDVSQGRSAGFSR
jgi:hypothetical protein